MLKKLENFWYYNWGKVCGALLALVALTIGLVQCANNPAPDFAFAYIGKEQVLQEAYMKNLSGLEPYISDVNGNGTIDINKDNLYVLMDSMTTSNTTRVQNAMVTEIMGGYSRLYIADMTLLDTAEIELDFCVPLEELFPGAKGYEKDGHLLAISVEGCKKLEAMGIDPAGKHVFIRAAQEGVPEKYETAYQESAVAIIKYLLE